MRQIGLGREGQDRLDRRVSRLAERRAAAAGLSHLKLDDRRALEVLRNSVGLIRIGTEHQADEIAAGIHADMPWMTPATDLLWKSMRRSVRNGDTGFRLPPVLLDGPPGIGKSMWARQLSTALGVPRCAIEATVEQASLGIVGSQRGWSNAQPGRPLMMILKHLIANPVVVVDEVEKAGVATSTKRNSFGLTEGLLSRLEIIRLPPVSVSDLTTFARREGRRRGLTQASVEAVAETLEIAGQGRELNLRHVIRMLPRDEVMEKAGISH